VATITWVGHATALLDLDGVRLLTDPVLRDRMGPLVRVVPPVAAETGERIDAVLLSHLHADHADLPSLRRLGGSQVLAPRGAGRWLVAAGVPNVTEIGVGEEHAVGGVRVSAVQATHDPRRWPWRGPRAEPVGYVVRGSRSAYFAGDTDLYEGMSSLAGTIDVALLPVWGWGATLGPGHLDPEAAAEAAALVAPRVAVPIHWGTLAPMRPLPRLDDQRRPAREFHDHAGRLAPGVEVRVLAPGDRTDWPAGITRTG
jgi:L-ascorbate metabolism protein UlaG (beta-lactamase superfamily)